MAGIRRSQGPTVAVAWALLLLLFVGFPADECLSRDEWKLPARLKLGAAYGLLHPAADIYGPPLHRHWPSYGLSLSHDRGVGAQSPYDRPVLIVDPGMHTATINSASADEAGRLVVTGSDDKTLRIWSMNDGTLLRTIHVPAGAGDAGKIYSVAMSPDGKLVAAGGHTLGSSDDTSSIFLFDWQTEVMKRAIANNLPEVTEALTFSADGRYLAAVLSGANGLRVYDRNRDWSEVFRDDDYQDSSPGVAFNKNGWLATTSIDGKIRLYNPQFKLVSVKESKSGSLPWGLAFRPDGKVLAVGYRDVPMIDLLDARSLQNFHHPKTADLKMPLPEVAWSADGLTLLAGGLNVGYEDADLIFAWANAGRGKRRTVSAGRATISSIVGLPAGRILAASTKSLAVLEATGDSVWAHDRPGTHFRGQRATLSVSADGMIVVLDFERGKPPLCFDVRSLSLSDQIGSGDSTFPARQEGLPIENWNNSESPELNGGWLELDPLELSKTLAVHPDGSRFTLGTNWSLRTFDTTGTNLWAYAAPSEVFSVNIAREGRIVVAAYDDGTIRWHRMDDGHELPALMVLNDRQNWVAWTPEGFYAAKPGAYGVLRWLVNHGINAAATTVAVSAIPKLRRPDALPLILQELETARALGIADLAAARGDVQVATGAPNPPGARLHVLTIGINDYGGRAKRLRLNFASKDANDVFNALVNSEGGATAKLGGLYSGVSPAYLHDQEATKEEVFEALASMERNMAKDGTDQDLAVVMFSGHGAALDGEFYLLPYGVDASTKERLEASAIPASELRRILLKVARHGRVLVLLDACYSNAITNDGTQITPDPDHLRSALVASNVTVLTSSSADEVSREDSAWANGAFTKVLLEAFGRAADTNNDGVISMSELTAYLTAKVPALTGGHQHVGISQTFERELFVAGF